MRSSRLFTGCTICYCAFTFLANPSSPLLAQYSPNAAAAQAAPNDPTVVRTPSYSLQSGGSNMSPQASPQIAVQANGQRLFNTPPSANGQALSHSLSQPSNLAQPNGSANGAAATSAVQPASWSTESKSTRADPGKNLETAKARVPLELKSSTKEAGVVEKPRSHWGAALSMFFSLAIVLSLFLLIAWLFRKSQPSSFIKLPKDVVQVMGRTSMAPRQQVYVVRFGNKMLLVSHQPGQTQTLAEITDANEIERMAALCESNQSNSITHSFRDVLNQVASGRSEAEPRVKGQRRAHLSQP